MAQVMAIRGGKSLFDMNVAADPHAPEAVRREPVASHLPQPALAQTEAVDRARRAAHKAPR
jgi:hypothetical protein